MAQELLPRIVSLFIGYCFGNILTAFLVARLFGTKNPTEFGSKNPGTANVGAVLGKKAGILVLIGDLLKSIIALVICLLIFESNKPQLIVAYCGLGLTLGHDFPLWNHFQGGKGVAVSVPVIVLLNLKWAAIFLLIALILVILMRNLAIPPIIYMSLMTIFTFLKYGIELGFLMTLMTGTMIFKYRFDLNDLAHNRAKQVDILTSLKSKLKK